MEDCIFCKIVRDDVVSNKIIETDDVIAFDDIHPQAPVHIQIIPKRHISSIKDVKVGEGILEKMFDVANKIAIERGISEQGYRLVINCGPLAGQSVMHLHLHLLGGRPMRWPPG
ncbi:MAG: histidine triad nucleotide-binding protein [bacterium]